MGFGHAQRCSACKGSLNVFSQKCRQCGKQWVATGRKKRKREPKKAAK